MADAPDLSEFVAQNRSGCKPCVVGAALGLLDDERRRSLAAALEAPDIKHTAIAKVLARWGMPASDQSVGRHRAGECCCGR